MKPKSSVVTTTKSVSTEVGQFKLLEFYSMTDFKVSKIEGKIYAKDVTFLQIKIICDKRLLLWISLQGSHHYPYALTV